MKVFRAIAMTHFCVCRRCNKTNMPTTLQHFGSLLSFLFKFKYFINSQNLLCSIDIPSILSMPIIKQVFIWNEDC